MLSMVVGDEIWRARLDPVTKQSQYLTEVELQLVNQVILTRSIVHSRAADSASGQAARLIAKLTARSDRPTTPPASAAPSETPAPGPGGTIQAMSDDGTTIALKRVYPRPIAIGFRHVSQRPLADVNDDDAPSSIGVTVAVNAQPEQSAPPPNGARELECDDLCIKVGRALNQDVLQSKSGTGRGVVTKIVPLSEQGGQNPPVHH
jgi:hypothetical protein